MPARGTAAAAAARGAAASAAARRPQRQPSLSPSASGSTSSTGSLFSFEDTATSATAAAAAASSPDGRSEELKALFGDAVVSWYGAHRRELPWRECTDGYRVWVSEIMLQQTRVDTVKPFYRRWLDALPTVQALSEASPDRVRELWAGLGFYRRADNLRRGAVFVCEELGGVVPVRRYDDLRRIPGVGEYTAGAIASVAGGVAVPAVDGNHVRLFARFFALAGCQPARAADVAAVRRLSAAVLAAAPAAAARPGDFNQGLMDLGATVCTPVAPACGRCPLAASCGARRMKEAGVVGDIEGVFPLAKQKAKTRAETWHVAVVVGGDAADAAAPSQKKGKKKRAGDDDDSGVVLVVQREEGGLLGGMWECPSYVEGGSGGEGEEGSSGSGSPPEAKRSRKSAVEGGRGEVVGGGGKEVPGALRAVLRSVAGKGGGGVGAGLRACDGPAVVHKFSHIHATLLVYAVRRPRVELEKAVAEAEAAGEKRRKVALVPLASVLKKGVLAGGGGGRGGAEEQSAVAEVAVSEQMRKAVRKAVESLSA